MGLDLHLMIEPDPQALRDPPPADRPGDGDDPGASSARRIPSMAKIASLAVFAASWHALRPDIPLIPLRADGIASAGHRPGPGRTRWAPASGRGDAPPEGAALASLLEADPSLRVGVRLGSAGPGGPRLVDVMAGRADLAAKALLRLLGAQDRDGTATWQDDEGTHRLYVGDERLAAIGRPVIGSSRGDRDYPGLEIRLGSADLAESLAVLPAAPRRGGRRRGKPAGDRLLTLPDRFYEDLASHARPIGGIDAEGEVPPVAAKRGTARARPAAAILLAGPSLAPWTLPDAPEARPADVVPPAPSSPGPILPEGLSALGEEIREAAGAGDLLAFGALEHYRKAGELLIRAKDRVGHGGFGAFVEQHCPFGVATASGYMRVYRRWPEVEAMRASNRQPDADLTLKGVLKGLAGNRVAPEADRPVAEVPEEDVTPPKGGGSTRDADGPGASRQEVSPVRPEVEAASGPADLLIESESGAGDLATILEPVEASRGFDDLGAPPTPDAGGLRALLATHGHAEDYDADAAAWHDLRPAAAAILARDRPGDHAPGLCNYFVSALARARPPEEWLACPDCGGSGLSGDRQGNCGPCLGVGYRIDGLL